MITLKRALELRPYIVKASASLPDEDALNAVELFPAWAVGIECVKGLRYRHGEDLYRCEQTHTTQEDWPPDTTPAMFTRVPKPGEIPVWRQPTGAQDAYAKGDRVHYPTADDPVYESTIDANVYAPGVYGWEMVTA